MRILIVEDNSLMGTGLQSALTGSGFEVAWVKDGESALTTQVRHFLHVSD